MPRFIRDQPDSEYKGKSLRRRQLIDNKIQGRLLVAMVVLEVGMLAGVMIYLYFQFSAIIDQSLFVIHRSAQKPLLPAFLKEMGTVVMIMSVLNTLALLIAHKIWVQHIREVLDAFRKQLQRMTALNFCHSRALLTPHHEVLQTVDQWRQQESQRYAELALEIDSLPKASEAEYSQDERVRMIEKLRRCQQLVSD